MLNQKKSKKYLVQNQNNFVPASKDLVSFWCRNKINLVQNQIQLPKSFGAEKNCFGAGKKPSWCEKKIILVQKREKPAGPVWCRKKIFWCRNRSLPLTKLKESPQTYIKADHYDAVLSDGNRAFCSNQQMAAIIGSTTASTLSGSGSPSGSGR